MCESNDEDMLSDTECNASASYLKARRSLSSRVMIVIGKKLHIHPLHIAGLLLHPFTFRKAQEPKTLSPLFIALAISNES